MSANSLLSIEEIISLLNHSSLPTVIVEGADDIIVYRRIEDEYSHIGVSVLSAGGRNNVLQIFNRMDELKNPEKVLFIVDQDTWIYTSPPEQYVSNRLLLTHGYSLENDAFIDGRLENFLTQGEKTLFESDIRIFTQWFALAIKRLLEGDAVTIELYPGVLLDDENTRNALTQLKPHEVYPQEMHQEIYTNYPKLLRGKSLMQILCRQVAKERRPVRMSHKYFLEAYGVNRGPLLAKLFEKIGEILTPC